MKHFWLTDFFGLDLHAVMHRCLRGQLHHSPPWEVLFRFLKTSTPCSGDCATTPQLLLPSVSLSLCTLLNTVGSLDPCSCAASLRLVEQLKGIKTRIFCLQLDVTSALKLYACKA